MKLTLSAQFIFPWLVVVAGVSASFAASTSCWIMDASCVYGLSGQCTPQDICTQVTPGTCNALGNNYPYTYIKKFQNNVDFCNSAPGSDCQQCIPPDDGSTDTCQYKNWCLLYFYSAYDTTPCTNLVCIVGNKYCQCMGSRTTPSQNPDDYCD